MDTTAISARALRGLVLLGCFSVPFVTGCSSTTIHGRVVSCADKKPIADADVRIAKTGPDPNDKKLSSDSYGGTSAANGTFAVDGIGDPASTYWHAKVTKTGYGEGDAHYAPGAGTQDICLTPAK